MRRNVSFGLALGTFDVGLRFATLRYFTEGLPHQYPAGYTESWMKPAPIMMASVLSSIIRAPLEIAKKAFQADKKFPKEIRHGYSSIRSAFFRLAAQNPTYLFKNSYPTILGTIVQSSFMFTLYDYMNGITLFFHDDEGL